MPGYRQRLGASGEDRAAAWYRAAGYEVVARNWRCHAGEIDLVCRRGRLIVFCEVKTRRSSAYGTAAEAVTLAKQRRIRRLAAIWMSESAGWWPEARFDVVAITGDRLEVLTAAW